MADDHSQNPLSEAFAALVVEEAAAECEAIDEGEWSAFREAVLWRVDAESEASSESASEMALSDAVVSHLREERDHEVDAREFEFAQFAAAVQFRIDGEATEDQPEKTSAVGALLREETARVVLEREDEFVNFARAVEFCIDEQEQPAALDAAASPISAIVREDVAAATEAMDWTQFATQLDARLDAKTPAAAVETVTVAELLKVEAKAELLSRDGAWTAFAAAVDRRIDEAQRVAARLTVEAKAVESLKSDVEQELGEMEPQFEEAFREGVEKRIFKSGIHPSLKTRFQKFLEGLKEKTSVSGWGWTAAAAAAAIMIFAIAPPVEDSIKPQPLASGQVVVEQISFEGDVTVMEEDGVTIIWLDDAAS